MIFLEESQTYLNVIPTIVSIIKMTITPVDSLKILLKNEIQSGKCEDLNGIVKQSMNCTASPPAGRGELCRKGKVLKSRERAEKRKLLPKNVLF